MQSWHSVFLGLRELPKEISEFDLQSFFTFTNTERAAIENRRQPLHRLGLALHIGFLRMCGRPLDAFRIIPAALWRHLGAQCGVGAPDIASLRSLYSRGRTLYDHQQLACRLLGFTWMTEHQRRYFVRVLRDELVRTSERNRLLAIVRGWLYERHVIIPHTRLLRRMIAAAVRQFEEKLKTSIVAKVPPNVLSDWRATPGRTLESGVLVQSWLSEAPPKHSSPQIMEMLKRIEFLCSLDVHRHLTDISDALIRRYGYRLALRAPTAGTRIQEPNRTIEIACFLRYCLLNATDQLVLMLRRRVADLWREASGAKSGVDWANLYKQLISELRMLATRTDMADHEAREQLIAILADHSKRKPPSRAHLKREHLVENIRPVHTLLVALVELPWKSDGEHPVIQAMDQLRALYNDNTRILPRGISIELGSVWRPMFDGDDRDRAHRALEVATLLAFRRALRNGSVWIEHSFTFRSRSRLFISKDRWTADRTKHYTRLALPQSPKNFLDPLLDRVRTGLNQVAQAVQEGRIRIDEDIHLHALVAEAEDVEVKKLRTAFDQEIGDVQLPDLMLMVDAQVRFSWIMLGHEPRSSEELLMVYAGILAHGTSMSAAETARMIPQLSASNVRQAMHWAGDRPRLANAASAVFEFMHQHPIAETWGRPNLASSDMMSLETTRRVWQARLDPRRRTPSIGIYTHVHDRWGIFYAQPIVLNERQAGAAIEGVIRQDRIETTQLAVDTHGYTDFAMALARLLGFDLCPCLRELKQRKLYVPHGFEIPKGLEAVCSPTVSLAPVESRWDNLVHLTASVDLGHSSAISVLSRFGSAAKGDPIYEAGIQLGHLLRTVFLCDLFTKEVFQRELRHVLNHGESVNALKRAIYIGRVASYQARREEEMQSVADALSLLANIVMAWNTVQMQTIFDGWNRNLPHPISKTLMSRIAPTHIEGINLRGTFQFPIERFSAQLLPSSAARRSKRSSL